MCDFDSNYDSESDVGGNFDSDVSGDNTSDISMDTEIETLDINVDAVSEDFKTDVEMLDIDNEVADIPSDNNIVSETFFDDFCLDELDDGNYHATHLSEEEVQQIDDLWKENKSADIEPYYAERMTEEEVARIGELNQDKALDVEHYHAVPNDLDTISEADADCFAAEIEALSLDELEVEQERLDKLHNDAEMNIFGEYDANVERSMSEDQFHDLIDGLPRESLERLRTGLENRDQDVLDYFGIDSGENDNDDPEELVLKRSR